MARSSKKQLPVAFDAGIRARLDAAATARDHSVAEEIRQRIERTLDDDALDSETRKLLAAVKAFTVLVRLQTGHAWHSHPAANRVLRHAIATRLARLGGIEADIFNEPQFKPDELPTALLVASNDVKAMGQGLEAIEFYTPKGDSKRLEEMYEESAVELRELHSKGKKP